MRVTFTGRKQSFTEAQEKKLAARIVKIAKLAGSPDEQGLHVAMASQRHLTKVEVTLHCFGRDAAAVANGADDYQAFTEALEKLEGQVGRLREKRQTAKTRTAPKEAVNSPAAEAAKSRPAAPRLRRVTVGQRQSR